MRLSQAPRRRPTALLVTADGVIARGEGLGATGSAVGEICFNTAMTGYQEILTDPSYAEQIVTFTFPHIGNVGVNSDDIENATSHSAAAARGAIVARRPTSPSNYRSQLDLSSWMRRRGIVGLAGVDTRALTNRIRENGMMTGVIAHEPSGEFDEDFLVEKARDWAGLEGVDLAPAVTGAGPYDFNETAWRWGEGHGQNDSDRPHVVVVDFGVKRNILRLLNENGARLTIAPPRSSASDILALAPDGVVLSNGPGDPAATAQYAAPMIRALIDADIPVFGICLGHQLLALAAGAETVKMTQGHHGANHPVKNLATGAIEIVSMNHGFTVDTASLPSNVTPTFTSLFDGSNSGIKLTNARASSVQHHPEASPGPQDSFGVFKEFVDSLRPTAQ